MSVASALEKWMQEGQELNATHSSTVNMRLAYGASNPARKIVKMHIFISTKAFKLYMLHVRKR